MTRSNDFASYVENDAKPDAVIPEVFYDKHPPRTGSNALMIAVLEDAIRQLLRYVNATETRGQRAYLEAVDWLNSEKEDGPFSFVTICEALNLDSDCVRKSVRCMLAVRRNGNGAKASKSVRRRVSRTPIIRETLRLKRRRP